MIDGIHAAPAEGAVCPDCGGYLPVTGARCSKCLWKISFGADSEDESADMGGDAAWANLGDYELYEEIAHGGMGVVYRARQRRLGRTVAVKVLRGGALAGVEARRRFRREAESVARLQHPGVVAIHDVGEDQGVCWFSMDYVPGENLAQRVQHRPLAAAEAADCVRQVSEAIAHAHSQGVLHRDLKPSNILMGLDDVPKVTDFGLARQLEENPTLISKAAAMTHSGQTLGSPGYAAPEQALKGEASVRSDVYGLGAVLYHMLTGRAPFVGPTLDSVLLQLREAEPVAPRRLNPTVPVDLETVCLKCLEKQPDNRYASALAVAEDLRRFAAGEPLQARPVGAAGRAVRWCRRRPALAGMMLALAVAALSGAGGVFFQWRRAEQKAQEESRQRVLAEANERSARLRTYTAGVFAASQALVSEDMGLAGELLESLVPAPGAEDFRGPEWYLLKERTQSQDLRVLSGHPWIVACLAASPDGKYLASGGRFVTGQGSQQSTFFVWEPTTGRRVHEGRAGMGSIKALQFSPDGTQLMLAAAGRTRLLPVGDWAREEAGVPGSYGCLAFKHPWLAVTEPGTGQVVIYETAGLTEIRRLPSSGLQVIFSQDDEWLVVLDAMGKVEIWPTDASEGGPLRVIDSGQRRNAMALSPDKRWLALCGGNALLLHDLLAAPGTPPQELLGHRLDVKNAVFSPQGDYLISTGSDRTIRFWRPQDGKALGTLRGHRDEVWCAELDPLGRWLTTGGKDATVRLWPVKPPQESPGPAHHVTREAVWSADGSTILLCQRPDQARLYVPGQGIDLPGGRLMQAEAAVPGGGWCRFLETPGRIEFFNDSGTVTRIQLLEGNPEKFKDIYSIAWSGDGQRFALVIHGQLVGVWETGTGRLLGKFKRPAGGITLPVALNQDGRLLAVSGSMSSIVRIVDVDTGAELPLAGHRAQVTTLAFSPDSRQLASGSVDATVRLWNTTTGASQAVLRGHVQDVNWVAYAPGGRTLASLGNFEAVRLWNLETATEVAVLENPHVAHRISFSPDGQWLAVHRGDPAERPSQALEKLWLLRTGNATHPD